MLSKVPRIALSATLLSALLLPSVPALAADPDQVRVAIPIGGLDLASEKGQAVLRQRINLAASELCGGPPIGSLLPTSEQRTCIDTNRKSMTEQARPRIVAQQSRTGRGG